MEEHENKDESPITSQLAMLLHSGSMFDASLVEKVFDVRLQPTWVKAISNGDKMNLILLTAQNRNILQYRVELTLDTIDTDLHLRKRRSILYLSKVNRAGCIKWPREGFFSSKLGEVQQDFNLPPRRTWKILHPANTDQFITISPSADIKCVEHITLIQTLLEQ